MSRVLKIIFVDTCKHIYTVNLKVGKQVSDVQCEMELWIFIRLSNELSLGKSLNFSVQIS